MIRRSAVLLACALLASACSEELTTPADCPALCPGGGAEFRDTVITAVVGLDSSYSGYLNPNDLLSLLVANGGSYGQARAVIRFLPRGDSVLVRDTARVFTVDSVHLELGLQRSDSTIAGVVLEVYRLPLTIDSTSTVAQIDAAMTPARLLKEFPLSTTSSKGTYSFQVGGADLAAYDFTAADSTRLQIGLRIRAPVATGIRIGATASGNQGPAFATLTHITHPDTGLRRQLIQRTPSRNFTVREGVAVPPAGLLAVGGDPVARSFVRFDLPAYLRDSATIIRATLQMTMDGPVFGIPADTTLLDVAEVLADFGAKSPILSDFFASVFLTSGQSTIDVEVAQIVKLWQGKDALPSIIRLSLGSEGGSYLAPRFLSSKHPTSPPRIRITYRRPFAFEGF